MKKVWKESVDKKSKVVINIGHRDVDFMEENHRCCHFVQTLLISYVVLFAVKCEENFEIIHQVRVFKYVISGSKAIRFNDSNLEFKNYIIFLYLHKKKKWSIYAKKSPLVRQVKGYV